MGKSLAPDRQRIAIAVLSATAILLMPTAWAQIGVIILAGLIDLSVGMAAGLVVVLACSFIDGNAAMTLPVVALMLLLGAGIGACNGGAATAAKVGDGLAIRQIGGPCVKTPADPETAVCDPVPEVPLDEARVKEDQIGQIMCQGLLHAPQRVLRLIRGCRPLESSQAGLELGAGIPGRIGDPITGE